MTNSIRKTPIRIGNNVIGYDDEIIYLGQLATFHNRRWEEEDIDRRISLG